jgi:hypothetical protein
MGLSFVVPEQWQLVRHGLSPDDGRLVFVDRRRQRLTVSWAKCAERPDLGRLIDDYERQRLKQESEGRFRIRGSWRGLVQRDEFGERVCRAVTYESGLLVEVQLLLEADAENPRQALSHFVRDFAFESSEGARRWTAFDVDLVVPPRHRLESTDVKPADVRLSFEQHDEEGRHTGLEVTVRRLGMARSWFDGDLEALVRSHWPKWSLNVHAESGASGEVRGDGLGPGPVFRRWLKLVPRIQFRAWSVPEENAIYELAVVGPQRGTDVNVEPYELRLGGGARSRGAGEA